MYLKKLEMRGFKSFADKTEIIYKNGVTCIVGPNGSGKSNITDAVRWVLGEQKIKTLRGAKMEDVIFNGTKHRKPLGLAEVSLTFDNTEGYFPLDFQEVTVTRRVYRSGDSEYVINGSVCLLRDVKELFMGTGMGTDGYSIIGQGRIDRILSHNAEERRQIFEEAAGIVKYKTRKALSEKKLANTQANLLRAEDIINELKSRVTPLEKESEKAQAYLEYDKERRHLEIGHYIGLVDKCIEKQKQQGEEREKINKNLESSFEKWNRLDGELENLQNQIETIDTSMTSADQSILKFTEDMGHIEAKQIQIFERQKNIEENKKRSLSDIFDLEKDVEKNESGLISTKEEKAVIEKEVTQGQNQLAFVQSSYDKIAQELTQRETSSNLAKKKTIEILNAIEEERVEIARKESAFENWLQREKEIAEKHMQIEKTQSLYENQIFEIEKELSDAKQKYNDCAEKKKICLEEKEKNLFEQKEKEREREHLVHKIMKSQNEKQVLEDMEKSFDGYDHSVKNILRACEKYKDLGKGIHGVVAGLFSVPARLEKAIEVVLGRQLQHVVTQDEADAKRLIDHLKKNKMGRVTFLPLSNIRANKMDLPAEIKMQKGVIGVASEKVECAPQYGKLFDYLLCRTLIVEDYQTAVICLKARGLRHRIVTIEGEILIPGGAITGGSFQSRSGQILGRKRRIKNLENQIKEDKQKLEVIEKTCLKGQQKQEAIEENIKTIENEENFCHLNRLKWEGEATALSREKEKIDSEKVQNRREHEMAQKQKEQIGKLISTKKMQVENLHKENEKLSLEVKGNSEGIHNLQTEAVALSEKMTQLQIEQAGLLEKQTFKQREYVRMKELVLAKQEELSTLKKQQDMWLEQEQILGKEKISIEKQKEDMRIKLLDMEKRKQMWLKEKETHKTEQAQRQLLHSTEHKLWEQAKEGLHKKDIVLAKLEAEKENIVSNLWEKYEISLRQAQAHRLELDEKTLKNKLNAVQKSIKNLGEVNLSSIEEYKTVKERFDFLSSQREDLLKAQKSLEKVIGDMEKEMTKRFKEAFFTVKEHFNEIFQSLFSGGHADLALLEEEAYLTSGIEILAQPPGKKRQSLDLLSGGERAMTAIALLFAILKARPTPFCVLDEIEAALDDVNVFRFASFLENFVHKSQFIIITHRKGTMEIADTLYGVTMEEHGISKIVSVKLDDVAS